MARAAPQPLLEHLRTVPLRGAPLVFAALVVWLAGAIYCSGYEKLLSGVDNWPGSLLWSAAAVLPWLALFEWSKTSLGQRTTKTVPQIAIALSVTAILSLLLEAVLDAATDHRMTPIALSLLRRLPAIGTCLVLILWSRLRGPSQRIAPANASLEALAPTIDWVEAADNYIELHIAGHTLIRRMTMRDAESALDGCGFVRIHRRFLVNGRRIAAVGGSNAQRVVRLSDRTELPIGRSFAVNLSRST